MTRLRNALRSRIRSVFADRGFADILRGSLYAITGRTGATCLGLVSSVIVARVYGAEAMGIVAVIESLLMIIVMCTGLGTNTSILRLIPEQMSKYSPTSAFRMYRKIQRHVGLVSVAASAVLFLFSDWVATRVFGRPDLGFLFALAAPFVVVRALMMLSNQAVRGLVLIKTFAFMQVLPVLATLLFLILGTLLFEDRAIPVYAFLAGSMVSAVTGIWVVERAFRRRIDPADVVCPTSAVSIVAVSLPMLLTGAMHLVIERAGVMMLGMFRTQAEVGLYAVAVKLAGLTSYLLLAVNTIAGPKFAELFYGGRTDEVLRVARKSTRLIFWATAPALLGQIVLGRPLLALLFGEQFASAYLALVLLALGQFVNSVSGSTGIFLNMTGQERVLRNIMLAAAGLSVVLNLALIPRFGINGAAAAAMVTLVCWNGSALLYIRAKFGRTIGYFPALRRGSVRTSRMGDR